MKSISVIIPVFNEEEFLAGCLASVRWADEVIVVDSNSSDNTAQIAKEHAVELIQADENSIVEKKNFGGKAATQDWLLFLDADERVSPALKREIIDLDPDEANFFEIPRLNYILGKALKHGGWYPDLQGRLVKRVDFLGWEGKLHEKLNVRSEEPARLQHDIIHFTHRSLDWMLEKSKRYAKIEAELRLKARHPKIKARHLMSASFREFWKRAVVKQGYRDGIEGWIEIFYQSFNAFLIMVYLWEMQRRSTLADTYMKLRREIENEL